MSTKLSALTEDSYSTVSLFCFFFDVPQFLVSQYLIFCFTSVFGFVPFPSSSSCGRVSLCLHPFHLTEKKLALWSFLSRVRLMCCLPPGTELLGGPSAFPVGAICIYFLDECFKVLSSAFIGHFCFLFYCSIRC